MRQHGVRHHDKAGDIGPFHIVDVAVVLLAKVYAVGVEVLRDHVQPKSPPGGYAARVAGLARRVQDARGRFGRAPVTDDPRCKQPEGAASVPSPHPPLTARRSRPTQRRAKRVGRFKGRRFRMIMSALAIH